MKQEIFVKGRLLLISCDFATVIESTIQDSFTALNDSLKLVFLNGKLVPLGVILPSVSNECQDIIEDTKYLNILSENQKLNAFRVIVYSSWD